MAQPLTDSFQCGRDLVAIVGAGGKTTLALGLAAEAKSRSDRFIVTTTTRMATSEGSLAVVTPQRREVVSAIEDHGGCLVSSGDSGEKRLGVESEWVDEIWRAGIADIVLVEADGARRSMVKAPADHEPVIPSASTLVVTVMAATAIGHPIEEVAHRPATVAAVVGAHQSDILTVERAATLLTSPQGGAKGIPSTARHAIAITRSWEVAPGVVAELASQLVPGQTVVVPRMATY